MKTEQKQQIIQAIKTLDEISKQTFNTLSFFQQFLKYYEEGSPFNPLLINSAQYQFHISIALPLYDMFIDAIYRGNNQEIYLLASCPYDNPSQVFSVPLEWLNENILTRIKGHILDEVHVLYLQLTQK